MVLQIYLDPCTINSRKVLAGLDLMGTEFNLNHIDYFTGQQKSPEFKKINPCATVPAATDGDLTLTESNAILQYAADRDGANKYYPTDLKKRAEVNRWLLWEASAWFPSCYTYVVEYVVKPLMKASPDQSVIDEAAPRFNDLAGILDAQLAKTKFLVGDTVTIADIAVASPMHLYAASRLPLDKYPNLKRWMTEGIEKLPSWQKTQAAVDKLVPEKQSAQNGNMTGATTENVEATFNYTKDVEGLTEIYFYETEKAKNIHEPGDDPHVMPVYNGWSKAEEFSVDKDGFALSQFKTSFQDWDNDAAVRADFYPEIVSFLKSTTGAKRILVFDHTIRSNTNASKKITEEKNTSQRAPVMLVHCDYTAESGPLRVKQLLPDEASSLLSSRVAFFNVWKPIRNTVLERPLAMCSVPSSPSSDFFKLHLRYRDRDGENYVMRHNDKHQWWYFPEMTPEQVILLKTYESETDGRARFVGHSAFEDPNTKEGAPLRESVEIRTIAFF